MNIIKIQKLFEDLKLTDTDNLGSPNPLACFFDSFSRVIGQSIYVVDYEKHEFVYVSSNPLFLCGYSSQDVLELGYSFYEKVMVEEDLALFWEIDKKGYELFCKLPHDYRLQSSISFDYRLKLSSRKTVMVTQKNTPFYLTEQGKARFALCIVSLSTHDMPGNVTLKVDGILYHYTYSPKTKRWKKVKKIILTEREKEILQLSTQGYSNMKIANSLFINIGTVKFHKSKIFTKLKVKNISEAITFAGNHKLL